MKGSSGRESNGMAEKFAATVDKKLVLEKTLRALQIDEKQNRFEV